MLGTLGAECPPPLISPQSTSEMPPPPAYVPNDATKKVLSVTARPSLLTFDTEGEVQVLALMQFNVDLLNDTVNLLDFTDSFPRVIKPMDFVAVQTDGVLFGTTLTYGPDDSAFDVDSRLGGGDATKIESLACRVLGNRCVSHEEIQHTVDDLRFVLEVAVDRHGGDAQLGRQLLHR